MIETLQDFTSTFPAMLQWFAVMLISAIPLVESYFGSAIGVISGLNPIVAVAAAVIGNAVSMLLFVQSAHRVRSGVVSRKPAKELTPRRARLKENFDKYGVAGVSLLGQAILPSQITSAAMVSFGAPKNTVILWQLVSITIWGVLFAVLATVGVTLTR